MNRDATAGSIIINTSTFDSAQGKLLDVKPYPQDCSGSFGHLGGYFIPEAHLVKLIDTLSNTFIGIHLLQLVDGVNEVWLQ
jgi:hypothetical protein